MERDQSLSPSTQTISAGSRHLSISPIDVDDPEMMDFGDVPDVSTGHKRTHSEMVVPENATKMPPTPETPENSNQLSRTRLQESEKPASKTSVMGPPALKHQKSFDQNGLPTSAQREAETPDGSPLPRSTKAKKATQKKRESAVKLAKEHGNRHDGDQSGSNGTSDRQREPRAAVADDGAEEQHDSEATEDQDEYVEGDEEDDEGEVEDEDEGHGDSPEVPIEPFDWNAIEKRLGTALVAKKLEEQRLWEEYSLLINVSFDIIS